MDEVGRYVLRGDTKHAHIIQTYMHKRTTHTCIREHKWHVEQRVSSRNPQTESDLLFPRPALVQAAVGGKEVEREDVTE